jgi:hypothetical protein
VIHENAIFTFGLRNARDFIRVEELGVVTGASGTGLSWTLDLEPGMATFKVGRGAISVQVPEATKLSITGMPLTRFGRDLLKLSNDYPPTPGDYLDRLCHYLEASGLKIISRS